ncbi:glycosyltransferase family 2 protein [Nocardioides sp. zg-1228]|uniref:glycosyltransferase family 2 protein n=1 Tax=Nocardioides sp. zg-1228 TaxID=2763008 RepID=UPI001643573F|nr:glycosyltransferase family 2 protein [Nocardioides sp. zg-1228]MBC2931414.1 glycosyltransferase family 2 protein [Nocardioides sp. zg-1228]QSF57030.1 glycosyltransferase family 2 protein [Nocardioides sp. zg-1228]
MTAGDPIDDEVVVVVVTYNSASLVADLLASLPTGMGDVPWRLAVADNDSHDGSLEVVRELAPAAVLVPVGRNAGYAAGINAAVAATGVGRAVLVLNPDVRLMPGCVPALLEALALPGTGVAVPRLLDGQGGLVPSMRREPTIARALTDALLGATRAGGLGALGEVVTDPSAYDRPATTEWAEGSTQLISAECWAACGEWDEGFFLYSEETDYHLRARDRGYLTRYVPSATAVHLGGDSTTSPRLWSMLVANRLRLFARRNGPVRTAAYWLVLLARETSRGVLGKQTSRAAVRALLSPPTLRAARGPEWGA